MTQSKHKNTPDRSTEWQSIKYLITSPQNCQDHGNIRNETLSDKETETSWENAVRFPDLDPEIEKKKKKKKNHQKQQLENLVKPKLGL